MATMALLAALLCLIPASGGGSGQPGAGTMVLWCRPAAGAGAGAVPWTLALRGGLDASRRAAQEAALRRAEEALAAQPTQPRDDAAERIDAGGADCSGGDDEPAGASGAAPAPPALLPRGVTWCELCGPRLPRAGPTRLRTCAMH